MGLLSLHLGYPRTTHQKKRCVRKEVINIDTNNEALNNEVETDNNPNTTPVLDQTTEDVETEAQVAEPTGTEGEAEEHTETGESSSKGYSNRVRELNAAKKEAERRAAQAEEEARSLRGRLGSLTGESSPDAGLPQTDFQDEPLIKPGEDIDAIEFERRLRIREGNMLRKADAMVQLRTKQAEAISKINSEAQQVTREYPELDPDSESFNKELSDAVVEATEAYVKGAPYSASVKQFVDKLMKPYRGAVTKEVGKAQETLARQVSQAALRPTSVRTVEKSAKDKTIAELEKELGMVQS